MKKMNEEEEEGGSDDGDVRPTKRVSLYAFHDQ